MKPAGSRGLYFTVVSAGGIIALFFIFSQVSRIRQKFRRMLYDIRGNKS